MKNFAYDEYVKIRRVLRRAQHGICAICGAPIQGVVSLDHVIPLSAGGPNRVGNLLATCRECNHKKDANAPTGCELIFLLAVNSRLGVSPTHW